MNFRSSFTSRSKQQGNTFIGIVIGLVIGLSIAVVVALMITKGSTPFTDKGHPSKATEPTAGQVADPNKPMYGNKEAAREAAKDYANQPARAPAPAPAAPAPSAADQLQAVVDKIQGTPAAPAKPAPATPNASNVTPQPVAKSAPAADHAGGDDKFIYVLQAGAFREIADAENVRAKLALLGFEANISDRTTDAGVLHRVQIGPYNQVETMNNVRRKLSENGIDVAVVRKQK